MDHTVHSAPVSSFSSFYFIFYCVYLFIFLYISVKRVNLFRNSGLTKRYNLVSVWTHIYTEDYGEKHVFYQDQCAAVT